MTPAPDTRIPPELLTRLEQVVRRGDLREKLADLSFIREMLRVDEKWSRDSSAIASFKTEAGLKLWWQDVGTSVKGISRQSLAQRIHTSL